MTRAHAPQSLRDRRCRGPAEDVPPDLPPRVPPESHRPGLRLLALLLLACVWLGATPLARADGCDGCPAPTLADLQQDPTFKLENRPTWWGGVQPDHYYLDKGECSGTIDGPPDIAITDAWLALRATGEVWHCPHSKSVDTITVESAASDSTEWSFSVKLSSELGPVGASFKREVEMGNTTGTTVTEVTRISKTITPGYCRRIQWKAYFQVAKVKATGTFHFKQRWAWWTKNTSTGSSQVHASGDIYMDCGSGELELTRKAPISGHFDLTERGCDDAECSHIVAKHLGLFPPWPSPDGPDAPPDEDDDEEPSPGDTPATSSDEGSDEPTTPDDPDAPDDVPDEPTAPDEPAAADDPAATDDVPDEPAAPDEPPAPDDGPQSSADLGEAPTGPATDPQESSP